MLTLIECGVPQGSNLGPLYILLFVSDLLNCLEQSKPTMFVDDTNISDAFFAFLQMTILHYRRIRDTIKYRSSKYLRMVNGKKLTLKVSKTEYLIVGSCHNLIK